MLVRLTLNTRNRDFFRKIKKLILRFLDAINGFRLSVFSDTSNMLSLCIFELFHALNFAATRILPFNVFLCYKCCYLHRF